MGKYTVVISSEAKRHLALHYKSENKIVIHQFSPINLCVNSCHSWLNPNFQPSTFN